MISGVAAVALAMISTVLAASIMLISYAYHKRSARSYIEKERRLPDATRYENLQSLIEDRQQEYESLRDRIHDARDLIDEADRRMRWMEETKEELAALESEKQEILRIQNELESNQVRLADLIEQRERAEVQLKAQQEEELRLKDLIASLKSETEKAQSLQGSISDLEARKDELEKNCQEATATLDVLRKECTDAETRRAAAMESVEKLEQRNDELTVHLKEFESEVEATKNALTALQENLKNLRVQLELLREEEKTVRSELTSLEKDRNEIRNAIEDLKTQKQDLEKECDAFKRAQQNELDTLKDLVSKHRHDAEEQQKSLEDIKEKLASLGQKKKKLEEENQSLTQKVENMKGMEASLAGQIPVLQDTISTLTSSMNRQSGGTSLEKSELWQPVLSVGGETSRGPSELESLEAFGRTLSSLGLSFSQRTIYAFHTALKSTSSSPLVTLAGISGTGKSELPRRYAETLGINFLNMAVQPRWDSPQDLFGFYDYLEQRFRPTELTRALLQVDPIGPEAGRGWVTPEDYEKHRLDDQMLLVLLDEMNLARVEYYFSEFLSKLETRRGTDVDDALKRQHAEIVLEVSGRGGNALPLRFFVDSNVLFVGTMNEDESTQALSDKVVDRSNLIRFGSPIRIEPPRLKSRIDATVEPPARMRRVDWQAWCREANELSTEESDRLRLWIETLRSALDAVGRPFAHRGANAILEYAANYPLVENRIEHAMADQIEQRILPKLIGLDMHHTASEQAILQVARVLDEIDDEPLKRRIESTKGVDYFQWTGLDRTAVEAYAS